MTVDEIKNNYEFKLVRRTLINEFPWIKDVLIDDDYINSNVIVFLKIIIDPVVVQDMFGFKINTWIPGYIRNKEGYDSTSPNMIFKISYDESKKIFVEPIIKLIRRIHRTDALPAEYKIPDKTMVPLHYIIEPDVDLNQLKFPV